MRGFVALLTLACCIAAAGPGVAVARSRTPRYELLGAWRFHRESYRFVSHRGRLYGRSRTSVRIGHCLVRRGTVIFSGYRFRATHGGVDYWRGRLALVVGKHCRRRLVRSTITMDSDLHFYESSRLPGGRKPPPSRFTRIRPPVKSSDPVLGTWTRNGAGVIVERRGSLYIGRARESFEIANHCTVPAGTVVWRLRPLAPGRYSGTIQAFFDPPGCQPAEADATTWRFGRRRSTLVRVSPDGQHFPYARA